MKAINGFLRTCLFLVLWGMGSSLSAQISGAWVKSVSVTPVSSAQFRIFPVDDAVLTKEQCSELIRIATATLEKENKKLCKYIDTEEAPDVAKRIFEIDESEKSKMLPVQPFYGAESGAAFYRVQIPCKEDKADKFSDGNVAEVYIWADNLLPFDLRTGKLPMASRLDYETIPELKDSICISRYIAVPKGKPSLTEEEQNALADIAKQGLKENLPDVHALLIPAKPSITARTLYTDDEARDYYRVKLYSRSSIHVFVSIWKDNKQIFKIDTESSKP